MDPEPLLGVGSNLIFQPLGDVLGHLEWGRMGDRCAKDDVEIQSIRVPDSKVGDQ